jgi:hypothetical protein
MGGNGQVWNDYATTMSTYDAENDDALLRAFEISVAPDTIIERQFDNFARQHRTRLESLGIMAGTFVNQHKLAMLQVGALTKHGDEIRQLKEALRQQSDIISALMDKLGIGHNPGTIIDNTVN